MGKDRTYKSERGGEGIGKGSSVVATGIAKGRESLEVKRIIVEAIGSVNMTVLVLENEFCFLA